MRKIINIFLISLFLLIPFLNNPKPAEAAGIWDCELGTVRPTVVTTQTREINSLEINVKGEINPTQQSGDNPYWIYLRRQGDQNFFAHRVLIKPTISGNGTNWTFTINGDFDRDGNSDKESQHEAPFQEGGYAFNIGLETADEGLCKNRPILPIKKTNEENPEKCTFSFPPDNTLKPGENLNLRVIFNDSAMRGGDDQRHGVEIRNSENNNLYAEFKADKRPTTQQLESETGFPIGSLTGGVGYIVKVISQGTLTCSKEFSVSQAGGGIGCTDDSFCKNNPNGEYCIPDKRGFLTCSNYPGNTLTNPCQPKDAKGNPQAIPQSCHTAIGDIGINPEGFARSVLVLVLSLSGGILIILFIANGFKLMTSQGDPKKIAEAREAIIAAIAGLLLIIFSLSILKLITVDILGLPGFS